MKPLLGALTLLAAGTWPALAAGALESDWSFSGFATLGAVYTRADHATFLRLGVDSPDDHNPDYAVDSTLGLQANFRITTRSTAVLQIVSRESPKGNYWPRATLAFVGHQFTPKLTARVGRMRVPFFMHSDSIDINYSHPWVRPPLEVYGLNPFTDVDGLDMLYLTRVGTTDIEVHPYLGSSRIPVLGGGHAKLRQLFGASLTLTRGNLSLSAGHAEARLSVERTSPSLLAMLNAPPALPPEVRARISGKDAHASFSSVGFQWDGGTWLLLGELAFAKAGRFNSSAHGWSLTAGRRAGSFTPHLTFSRSLEDEPTLGKIKASGDPRLTLLNETRNQSQRSITAGLRWDFAPAAAMKFEISRIHTDRNAWGSFYALGNPLTTRMGDRYINVLSVSVDVVF